MSDYHLLTQAVDERSIQVVFHIPVPGTGVNKAGVQWQDAIVDAAGGSDNISSVLVSVQGGAEETDMKSGALVEVVETVKINPTDSDGEKQTRIEERFTTLTTELVAEKQIALEWIGYNDNVA